VHDLLYLSFILDLGLIFLGLSPQPVSACEWCLVSRAFGSEFPVFYVRVWLPEVCFFVVCLDLVFWDWVKRICLLSLSFFFFSFLMLLVLMLIVYWFWQRQSLLRVKKGCGGLFGIESVVAVAWVSALHYYLLIVFWIYIVQ